MKVTTWYTTFFNYYQSTGGDVGSCKTAKGTKLLILVVLLTYRHYVVLNRFGSCRNKLALTTTW